MLTTSSAKTLQDPRDALRERLRAVVLLAGSVRASELGREAGRPLIDLPVEADRSVLSLWRAHVSRVGGWLGRDDLEIRVLIDHASPEPASTGEDSGARVRVTRDRGEYRGTGGVLGDLADEYADEDLLLVANAGQVLVEPLEQLAGAMAGSLSPSHSGPSGGGGGGGGGKGDEADLSLVAHEDGTPVGTMLLAARAMRAIPRVGFIDFKEQFLPRLARERPIAVVRRDRATAIPIRLLEGYLSALRAHHLRLAGRAGEPGAFDEDYLATFGVVEPGASVGEGARVHDSVVLRGGRVEAGAVVVRSVVAPGGVVARGTPAADRVITSGSDARSGRAG